MPTSPAQIVAQLRAQCDHLVAFTAAENPMTGSDAETEIFKQVVEIGNSALTSFFASQAPLYHGSFATDAKGRVLSYSEEGEGLFYSIFGEVAYRRSYYCGEGHGWYPMDAALNLPEKGPSDLRRKMTDELLLHMSYADATEFLARYFPVPVSTRCARQCAIADSADAKAYYDQAGPLPICDEATILVVEADGKGVPMVRPGPAETPEPGQPAEPKKRQGKKKDATVVSVSTHIPFVRTPEQVAASLFGDTDAYPDAAPETVRNKRVWATLEAKADALKMARQWNDQADGKQIQAHIALTDGLPGLQNAVTAEFAKHTLVLDLMHPLTYLWKAADAHFAAGPAKSDWSRRSVLTLLQGQGAQIIEEIDNWLETTTNQKQIDILETAAGYLERNLPYMRYDEYLKAGWPIATGIIEGACRHIVKDRCERSGMRWTPEGAEAILHLRCVDHNGDWEDYHRFRMNRRRERHYAQPPEATAPNSNVYRMAERKRRAVAV
jgi:hypothetical protein